MWTLTTLLSSGIISCAISSQAETWWLKSLNLYTPQIVRIINATSRPLVISFCGGTWPLGDELPLSCLLDPKVRLQLVSGSKVPSISSSFTDVFLYNAASYLSFIERIAIQP
ncbi:MAG: hypothetical protein KME22_10380 [Hassallia sp. WJT32-NPBG1]|nr:hypothetical protein [Hassallia sp. WJT32-NPBG1]